MERRSMNSNKPARKEPFGRPTKFKEEYCELLEQKMAEGFTHRAFCAELSITEDTFYRWLNKHAHFSEAHKKGKNKQHHWWEQLGRAAAAGKIENANTGIFVWMSKNVLGYRDKHEITGADGGPIQYLMQLSQMSNDDLQLKAKEAIKYLEEKKEQSHDIIDVEASHSTTVREPSS